MKKNYIKPELNVVNVEIEGAICAGSGTKISDGDNGGASIDFSGTIGTGDAGSAHSRGNGASIWGSDDEY